MKLLSVLLLTSLQISVSFLPPPRHPIRGHGHPSPISERPHPHGLAIILNPVEYALSPSTALPPVRSVFLGQAAMLALAVLAEIFTAFRFAPPGGLVLVGDSQSFLLSLGLSLPLVLATYLYDKVSLPDKDLLQRISRSNRVFSLRLIGRNTPLFTAAISAIVISFCAG